MRRTLGRVVWEHLLVEGDFYITGNRTKWRSFMSFSLNVKCSFKDGRLEAGEIAQWVSLLLHKCEDLDLHKNRGVVTHTVFLPAPCSGHRFTLGHKTPILCVWVFFC